MRYKILVYVLFLTIVYWEEIEPRLYFYTSEICYTLARLIGQTGIKCENHYRDVIEETYHG